MAAKYSCFKSTLDFFWVSLWSTFNLNHNYKDEVRLYWFEIVLLQICLKKRFHQNVSIDLFIFFFRKFHSSGSFVIVWSGLRNGCALQQIDSTTFDFLLLLIGSLQKKKKKNRTNEKVHLPNMVSFAKTWKIRHSDFLTNIPFKIEIFRKTNS